MKRAWTRLPRGLGDTPLYYVVLERVLAGAQAREPRLKWSVTEIPSLPLLHGLLSFVDALKGINRIYNVVIIDEVITHQSASIAGDANFPVWLI